MTLNAGDLFSVVERKEILAEFSRAFGNMLQAGETMELGGNGDADAVQVRFVLANEDRSSVATFEIGMQIPEKGRMTALEARAQAVELLVSTLHDWFENERWPHPSLDWQPVKWGTHTLHLRGSVVNEKLESMADALLAAAGYDTDR